jgi:hypothetical protein
VPSVTREAIRPAERIRWSAADGACEAPTWSESPDNQTPPHPAIRPGLLILVREEFVNRFGLGGAVLLAPQLAGYGLELGKC